MILFIKSTRDKFSLIKPYLPFKLILLEGINQNQFATDASF